MSSTRTPEGTSENEAKKNEEKKGLDLSISALVVGALASVTSAVVGSQLGVAGTLVGAAVGSTVAGLATALYNYGLDRTQTVVGTLVTRVKGSPDDGQADATASGPAQQATAKAGTAASPADAADAAGVAGHGGASDADGHRTWLKSKRTWALAGLVVTVVGGFVAAMLTITVFESATGTSLSGEQGTTIGIARERAATNTGQTDPTDQLGPSEASASPTPTSGGRPAASASPTPTTPRTTATATPRPTTTARPTAAATASPAA